MDTVKFTWNFDPKMYLKKVDVASIQRNKIDPKILPVKIYQKPILYSFEMMHRYII